VVEALPALGPVVGHFATGHLDDDAADVGLALGERGQLTRSAVEGELRVVVAVDLLETARGELDQRGENDLCVG
jgi:hypothetical protein